MHGHASSLFWIESKFFYPTSSASEYTLKYGDHNKTEVCETKWY